MKSTKLLLILAAFGALGLAACEQDGPMEEAGEALDNVGDSMSEAAQDACDAVGDATNSDVDC